MTTQNVTLRVSNVTKRFGEFTAVEDLSFDVRAGRVFGFLGPNGAGKTTTIRMIVGITAPDEGKILFKDKGERIKDNEKADSDLSLILHPSSFQDRIGYLP